MALRHVMLLSMLVIGSATSAQAQQKDPVDAAILKGREFLRAQYDPKGGGPQRNDMDNLLQMVGIHGVGKSSLAGLALLESGISKDNPSVINIANGLRLKALEVTNTYEVSLIIMFLDRLGSPDDEGLIQFMTLRLLTGQCADGTWSYNCSGVNPSPVELRQLQAMLIRPTRMVTVQVEKDKPKQPTKGKREDLGELGVPPKEDAKTPKTTPKTEPSDEDEYLKKIHPAVRGMARQIASGALNNGPFGRAASGDHSNTQFATVGLWCGRRHHIDVSNAFKELEKHYRDCQADDYGWGYTGVRGGSSPAMTCAGLMGLAMGQGGKVAKLKTPAAKGQNVEPEDNKENLKAIENGLKHLGDYLAAAANDRGNNRRFIPNDLSKNLYFMWSLERVAMIYGLTTIGKIDWYEWGSQCLVDSQRPNGTWEGGVFHGADPELNTSFALLFLNRANLAQDLSNTLKGKFRDPGTSRMRGGDLQALLKPGMTDGSKSKPTTTPKRELDPKKSVTPEPIPNPNTNPKVPPRVPAETVTNGAGKLARDLLAAEGDDQRKLFDKYRDTPGAEYTQALLDLAGTNTDVVQDRARDALASRLTRMKATTLNEYLKNENRELRFAAARACGAKGDKSHTPELIRLLADPDAGVIQAARVGLKLLSGKDFGPDANATATDKKKSVVAWQKWWDSQK